MRRRRERECKTKPKETQRLNKVMGKQKSMNRLETSCCFTLSPPYVYFYWIFGMSAVSQFPPSSSSHYPCLLRKAMLPPPHYTYYMSVTPSKINNQQKTENNYTSLPRKDMHPPLPPSLPPSLCVPIAGEIGRGPPFLASPYRPGAKSR